MKTLRQKNTAQNLGSEIHLARILLAKAESQLTAAKEQARIARRRRKEAKQAARHAKKRARQAKEQVAEAKLALAEAENKLAKANQRPVTHKPRSKPARTLVTQRKKIPAKPVIIHPHESVEATEPKAKRVKSRPKTGRGGKVVNETVAVPPAFKTPVLTASAPIAKVAEETANKVEQIIGKPIQTGVRGASEILESPVPTIEDSSAPNPVVTG